MATTIYLDNAATTKTNPEVVKEMIPYFTENYGNPSAIYEIAGRSKEAIEESRKKIAHVIGAEPEEIYFTAGGSESDNWALKAAFEAYAEKGNHIITTKIEHHAGSSAIIEPEGSGSVRVTFDEPQRAITPGQAAVFYQDGCILGGGTIE